MDAHETGLGLSMSGARPPWAPAAGRVALKMLRDQLVEVITCVRSQTTSMEGPPFTSFDENAITGAEVSRPAADGPGDGEMPTPVA